jgi:hypothetical protein
MLPYVCRGIYDPSKKQWGRRRPSLRKLHFALLLDYATKFADCCNFIAYGDAVEIDLAVSYSKPNQMHNISDLFYFGTTLYTFQTVFLSIIRSPRLYIQHQVYVIQVLWLLTSMQPQNQYDTYLMLYVQS